MPQQPHMFPNDVQDGIPMRRAEPTHRRNSALGASPKNKLTQTMLGKASHGGVIGLEGIPIAQMPTNLGKSARSLYSTAPSTSSSETAGSRCSYASLPSYLRQQPLRLVFSYATHMSNLRAFGSPRQL